MINREKFYNQIKTQGLYKSLKQTHIIGFNALLDRWESLTCSFEIQNDIRQLAYLLATVYHETSTTIEPIKEYGSHAYYVKMYWTNQKLAKILGNKSAQDAIDFAGKGFVQITGRSNYTKMGKLLGIDLANNPNIALTIDISTKIIFEGMYKLKSFVGDFTSKSLEDYFNLTKEDPINARRIINGTDKAQLIAGYYYKFKTALNQCYQTP